MQDRWCAECNPCGWLETFEVEDDAIAAAEEHVYQHHQRITGHERAAQKMGHVQMRGVSEIPPAILPVAGEPILEAIGSEVTQEVMPLAPDTQPTSE